VTVVRGTVPMIDAYAGKLNQSAARYPNIKPGQEFTGYE
jgi:hypothetical protein